MIKEGSDLLSRFKTNTNEYNYKNLFGIIMEDNIILFGITELWRRDSTIADPGETAPHVIYRFNNADEFEEWLEINSSGTEELDYSKY